MPSRLKKLYGIVLGATLLVAAALFLRAVLDPAGRLSGNGTLRAVSLSGVYSVGGEDFLPLTDCENLRLSGMKRLVARGHFSSDIEKNEILMLRIRHLRVTLSVNGQRVFAYGMPGSYPAFVHSGGSVWQSFVSPGITTGDEIEITLENAYRNGDAKAASAFLTKMRAGSERCLINDVSTESILAPVIGAVLLALGLVALLASFMGLCFKLPLTGTSQLFAGVMLAAGAWILTDYDYLSLLLPYPALLNLVDQVSLYLLPVYVALFSRTYIKGRLRVALDIDAWICTAFLLIGCVLQMLGIADLNGMRPVESVPLLLTMLASVICLFQEMRESKEKNAYYALLSLLPACVGVAADVCCNEFQFPAAGYGAPLGFLFFAVMQVATMFYDMQVSASRSLKLENDLLQNRVAMMLSQIQPHFLYNSLTAIKQLCIEDPARAEEAVGDFASYLRTNLDSISKNATIPFTRELQHVEHYIKLEQMRFGDRVKVAYDLRYKGFSVPTLTIQPLVENAIRYGITKKPKGGTVTIFSDETDTDFVIRISDDGVGFDLAAALSDDRSHIGLDNVKSRLTALCEGTLSVESEIGKGTVVTILIPKKEADSV